MFPNCPETFLPHRSRHPHFTDSWPNHTRQDLLSAAWWKNGFFPLKSAQLVKFLSICVGVFFSLFGLFSPFSSPPFSLSLSLSVDSCCPPVLFSFAKQMSFTWSLRFYLLPISISVFLTFLALFLPLCCNNYSQPRYFFFLLLFLSLGFSQTVSIFPFKNGLIALGSFQCRAKQNSDHQTDSSACYTNMVTVGQCALNLLFSLCNILAHVAVPRAWIFASKIAPVTEATWFQSCQSRIQDIGQGSRPKVGIGWGGGV